MKSIEELVRKNIRGLKPYSSARDEFSGADGVFLDANENPFGTLNRYPDPYQNDLKNKLSELKDIDKNSIFIGNGSDEVIDLAFRIFCEPGKDRALTFSPTYGMYEVSASINNIELIKVPLNTDFQIDFDSFDAVIRDKSIKLIFICSPNNPTGNTINNIEQVLNSFDGIVIIDEAYIDFSGQESLLRMIKNYSNLIVTQTLSKAYGLAAARIGLAFSNPEIIKYFNKVKPPYNISLLNQNAALEILAQQDLINKQVSYIVNQRQELEVELSKINCIKKIYDSDANFILCEVENANDVYDYLVSQKIITRNRNAIVTNCIRITVGTKQENLKLINALKEF